MTLMGYSPPHGTRTHRPRTVYLVTGPRLRTWCGFDLPDTWTASEVPTITCTVCERNWATEQAALAPFTPDEPYHYSDRRRPGLDTFTTTYRGREAVLYRWAVADAPRARWVLHRDARAPAGRPWQLDLDRLPPEHRAPPEPFITPPTPVAYFTRTTPAVEWTKTLVATGRLTYLNQHIQAGTWNPHEPPLSLTGSAIHKETNPA